MKRATTTQRKTLETNVFIKLNLDGQGRYEINTTLPFLDHMLEQFSKHSGFDLKIKAAGDTKIDAHHLVEDIGITLGEAIAGALKDKKGIARYGHVIDKNKRLWGEAMTPMDETLSYVAIDISGRPCLYYRAKFGKPYGNFDYGLLEDFFLAVTNNARITAHINLLHGRNDHHKAEAMFKSFGCALSMAVAASGRRTIPSTKGKI